MNSFEQFDVLQLRAHAQNASRLLKALANDNRLLILCILSQGELSVSRLNEQLDLSQSALSQHLAVLRKDGLVSTRRDSQTIYYSIVEGPAAKVIETLHGIYCPATASNANAVFEAEDVA